MESLVSMGKGFKIQVPNPWATDQESPIAYNNIKCPLVIYLRRKDMDNFYAVIFMTILVADPRVARDNFFRVIS